MTDGDDGGGEPAAHAHVDPSIDRIEFVCEDGSDEPPETSWGKVQSASITIDTDVDDLDQLRSRSTQLTVGGSGSQTSRGKVPPGAVDVDGGPVDPDAYAARYGTDGGFTDALRRVARHAGADRLTVVRLPGVRRINAYYLHTDVDALAETLARLDRQTPVDGITPLSLGAHAIVRLDFHVDHDGEGADDGSELLYPTGDDALDAAVLDGGSP